jgi:hypothetical protein
LALRLSTWLHPLTNQFNVTTYKQLISGADDEPSHFFKPRLHAGCFSRPAYALLKIEEYYRITGHSTPSLLEVMDGIAGGADIDFEPPRLGLQIQPASLD